MAEKVDMSLDDIIKMTRGNRRGRTGSRGGGTRGGGLRGRRGGSPRGGGLRGRGGIQKRRSASFGRTRNLDDDTVWEHDLYDSSQRRSTGRTTARYNPNSEGHLIVSNLDFAVNDSDIYELFSECGPLKKAVINYDRSARSMGTAEVVFDRRSDAIKAMKQYNNVPLDGLPMKIELTATPGDLNGTSDRGYPAGARRNYGGGGRNRSDFDDRPRTGGRSGAPRGGGRGRGRGGRRGGDKKVPTAEELDADLDAYTSKMETE